MLGGWILLYHIYFSSIFVLPKFGYIVRPCGSEIFLKSEVFFKPNPKSLIKKWPETFSSCREMFKSKIKKFIKNHSNCMWSKEFFKVEQKYWLKLPLPLKLPQITVLYQGPSSQHPARDKYYIKVIHKCFLPLSYMGFISHFTYTPYTKPGNRGESN